MVNCHPFDAERSAGRTYLQGCHKSSPSPKDGAPKGLERPGSGHVQGTHFYPKSNFRQVRRGINLNKSIHSLAVFNRGMPLHIPPKSVKPL